MQSRKKVVTDIGGCDIHFSQSSEKPTKSLLVEIVFEEDMSSLDNAYSAQTGTQALGSATREIWSSEAQLFREKRNGVFVVANEHLLFGWCYPDIEKNTASAVEAAYKNILLSAEEMGYPALIRTWNYLPRIHRRTTKLPVYQEFCSGRLRAAKALGKERVLCAATVVGTAASRAAFHFLAAKAPGRVVDNERQTLPSSYPIYGESERPLFARAMIKSWRDKASVFVSGTASIVGHKSSNAGDLAGELREIERHLEVLKRNSERALANNSEVVRRFIKVYLSSPRDFEKASKQLASLCNSQGSMIVLKGDICRPELSVEIETICS